MQTPLEDTFANLRGATKKDRPYGGTLRRTAPLPEPGAEAELEAESEMEGGSGNGIRKYRFPHKKTKTQIELQSLSARKNEITAGNGKAKFSETPVAQIEKLKSEPRRSAQKNDHGQPPAWHKKTTTGLVVHCVQYKQRQAIYFVQYSVLKKQAIIAIIRA